jgi:hypothetical protein
VTATYDALTAEPDNVLTAKDIRERLAVRHAASR